MHIDRARRLVDLDPREPGFVQNPYAAYAQINLEVPLFFWEQYGHWCVSSHSGVTSALRDGRFGRQLASRAGVAEVIGPEADLGVADFEALERHSLLELEPPDHTRLRGLVNRAFVARRIAHLRPAIAQLAHELIDGFAGQGQANLLDPFATQIPVLIIADLLGVARGEGARLLDWSHRMVAMYQFRRSTDIEASANAAAAEFSEFLTDLARKRRKAPRDDLVSALLDSQSSEGRLSERELVATCVLLLNAGHEATVHAIGNGLNAILQSGISPDALFSSAAASAATVEEVLRFDPPLHLFTRYALEDCEWNGIPLRRGEKIGLLLAAANRDPARFNHPDRFDPTRTPNPHASFGGGIHFCLGAPLARLELEVALPIVFQRLPKLRLAAPPVYRDTYHFHQLDALEVSWSALRPDQHQARVIPGLAKSPKSD